VGKLAAEGIVCR